MSGTSLDGLDLALCTFQKNQKWEYEITHARTIAYAEVWTSRLRRMHLLPGDELIREHFAYGELIGQEAKKFLEQSGKTVDFIASHGHTIFHQPAMGFTFQAGAGTAIAAASGLPVIYDFRSADVALGGQGAPLVPIGDRLLFPEYDFCLNLGGIANISFELNGERKAFDIGPCNLLLNELASRAGMTFDDGGQLAATGQCNEQLLLRLNQLPYYSLEGPKSLGREDIERDFLPLLDKSESAEDLLATCTIHLAQKIKDATTFKAKEKTCRMLVTGGGTWNRHLVNTIASHTELLIDTASPELINFKEALIFAFLGVLRWQGEINVLSSVTGASKNHCAGNIVLP